MIESLSAAAPTTSQQVFDEGLRGEGLRRIGVRGNSGVDRVRVALGRLFIQCMSLLAG